MSDSNADAIEQFVRAAMTVQGYRFAGPELAAVLVQFSRIDFLAQGILNLPVPFGTDVAAVFRP